MRIEILHNEYQLNIRKWSLSLVLFSLFLTAIPMQAENNIPAEKISIEEAFTLIGIEYGVHFNYDRAVVADVEVDYESGQFEKMEDALQSVFSQTHLKYEVFDQRYVAVYRQDREGVESMKKMVSHFQEVISSSEDAILRSERRITPPLATLSIKDIYSKRIVFSVSGTVTDQAGEPLIGVNIQVKGTDKGTATDFDGNFSLEDIDENAVLVVSYIGYQTQEVTVSGRSELTIILTSDAQLLDEVVVVGYGTQKKVNLTGAVSSISEKQLERRPIISTSTALQGLAPGVTVTSQTGAPGGDGGNINIRGINSFGGSSNSPLVLIDGVEGSINNIDINEVESISVLKDAASAAIYGSRAANGVILITTKRAKEDFSIEYKGYMGFQRPTYIPEVTNGLVYMEVFNEASRNDGGDDIYSQADLDNFRDAYNKDPDNYDWQKAVLSGSGIIHNHHIGITTSGNNISNIISLGFSDQDGLMKNTGFKRYSFRNNLDLNPTERLSINMDISMNNRDRTQISNEGEIWNYLGRMPTNIPIRTELGQWSEGWVKKNIVAYVEDGGNRKVNNIELIGNFKIDYKLTDWLNINGMAAPRYLTSNTHHFTKSIMTYNPDGSEAGAAETYTDLQESGNRRLMGTYQLILNGSKSFNENNFSFLVGTSRETYISRSLMGYRRDYIYDIYEVLNAGADNETKNNSGTIEEWLLVSGFGRLNYNYAGKYLFEANLRYDGTSRFTKDNRWATFPSMSVGWRISDENFMSGLHRQINDLKLRASWGKLGNQNIGGSYYPFTETLNLGSVPMGGNVYQMITQSTMSNPDLIWEETSMKGIGLDAILFNQLSVTFDYYSKITDGILMKLYASQLTGLNPPFQNAGKVSNKGWELSANYDRSFGDFNLEIGFNISDVKNEIIDMKGQTSGDLLRQQEGYPVNSIFGYVADGLYQSQEEIEQGPAQIGTLKPGDIRFVDLNGDGAINEADKQIIGNTIPRYTYGFNLGFIWKGLNFSAFFQGVGKVDGYLNSHYVIPAVNSSSIKPWQLDYWTEDNRDAALPRVTIASNNNVQNSSFWMKSAAYNRLKNLHLGYKLPESIFGSRDVYIYLNGQNLFTSTNFYPGYDPEVNYNAGASDGVSLGGGNFYPQVKSYTFGIDIKF